MSARNRPHSYDQRIMLESSALLAAFGDRPSAEDMARRPDMLRLIREATEAGSELQVATASYLELGWCGVVPGVVDQLELLAFDARAARALSRLSTLPAISQKAG